MKNFTYKEYSRSDLKLVQTLIPEPSICDGNCCFDLKTYTVRLLYTRPGDKRLLNSKSYFYRDDDNLRCYRPGEILQPWPTDTYYDDSLRMHVSRDENYHYPFLIYIYNAKTGLKLERYWKEIDDPKVFIQGFLEKHKTCIETFNKK